MLNTIEARGKKQYLRDWLQVAIFLIVTAVLFGGAYVVAAETSRFAKLLGV